MAWHDGEPLTARDVAYTYNRVLDSQAWAYVQYLAGVTRVEAPDDLTVVITCDRPSAGMLALYIPILPEHVWSKVSDGELETFENTPLVGSGPFRMVEARRGEWVKLAPNHDYPAELGGPPKVDAFYYVISQSSESMIQDYKAGALDAIVDWPASQYADLEDEPGTTVVKAPALGFHEMGFNCWDSPRSKGDPLLRDASIRSALHWAIDKQSIVATAMGGVASAATSLISPVQGIWRWNVPEGERYAFDPERAKQILEDAGYTDGDGDGVRESAEGDELEFRLTALSEYPEDLIAARKIASYAADVGIRLELVVKSEDAFNGDWFDDFDYDIFLWSWHGDIDPGFILSVFTTDQIRGWSDSQYSDPEYDRLFRRQGVAVDPEHPDDPTMRKAITDRMQAILYRDNPYVILWYNVNLQAFRTDRWTGYHPAPTTTEEDGSPFWNMLRTTYVDLEPRSPAQATPSGSSAWIPALAAAAALLAIVAVLLWRRRPRAVED
jgi:peptide/nickel transport system substrate-binding protein